MLSGSSSCSSSGANGLSRRTGGSFKIALRRFRALTQRQKRGVGGTARNPPPHRVAGTARADAESTASGRSRRAWRHPWRRPIFGSARVIDRERAPIDLCPSATVRSGARSRREDVASVSDLRSAWAAALQPRRPGEVAHRPNVPASWGTLSAPPSRYRIRKRTPLVAVFRRSLQQLAAGAASASGQIRLLRRELVDILLEPPQPAIAAPAPYRA